MAESTAASEVRDAPAPSEAAPAEGDSRDVPPTKTQRAPQAAGAEAVFWMRRSDQIVLAVLCGLLVLLSAWHWARLSGWGTHEVEIVRHPARQYDYRIDVNTATWVEWIQLPGIGEMLARRIIDDREQNGPFEAVEDLQRVKGIGPKTIENLRPYLRVETPVGDQPAK